MACIVTMSLVLAVGKVGAKKVPRRSTPHQCISLPYNCSHLRMVQTLVSPHVYEEERRQLQDAVTAQKEILKVLRPKRPRTG